MKHKINDKQRKSIITFCIVLTVLTILNILAFTTSTSLTKHTEDNTYEVSGTVVDFEYVEPGYFGQKIRHPHIIHLDNGIDCVFHYLNYEMHYDDPNQEKISNELEGQYVVIRLSKIDDRIITINTNEKCYLSFEASNRQHIIGIIGVVLFDFSVLFISFICFINPILPIKKRVDKKHMFKSYRFVSHAMKHQDKPRGYYDILLEPTGLIGYETVIVCSKEHPTFNEIISCLKKFCLRRGKTFERLEKYWNF